MKKIAKKMNKTLVTKAKENVSVTKKTGDGIETIKEGVVRNNPIKQSRVPGQTSPIVGMAKGVTKNMGDFESLRVDVWLSKPVEENADTETIAKNYKEVEAIIDKVLEDTVMEYVE